MSANDIDVRSKLAELERRIEALEDIAAAPSGTTTKSTKQKSLREFLNEKKPTTANNRGLCIAYFLETLRDYDCFNAEDIKAGFREARISVPKNPNDVINKNITKGFMMDAEQNKGGKKAWILTGTGMEVVEKGFGKEG